MLPTVCPLPSLSPDLFSVFTHQTFPKSGHVTDLQMQTSCEIQLGVCRSYWELSKQTVGFESCTAPPWTRAHSAAAVKQELCESRQSISAKHSGMQLNCGYFLPHSKANFCPPLDQNIRFTENVLPLSTLQTLTLVAHLFNTQRTDPLLCLALVTFKDSHSAWERTDINNYRIKCCQGIMFPAALVQWKPKPP